MQFYESIFLISFLLPIFFFFMYLPRCQYQEYENNKLKVIPQLSQISIDTSVNTENSHIPENGVKNDPGGKSKRLSSFKTNFSEIKSLRIF